MMVNLNNSKIVNVIDEMCKEYVKNGMSFNKKDVEKIKKYSLDFLEACSQAKEQGCKIVSEYRENLGHNPKYHICYFKYDILVNCDDRPPELEAEEIAGKWRLINE